MPDVLNGYEPAARFAERRALFDLKRRITAVTGITTLNIVGTYSGTSTPLPTGAALGDMWVIGTPVPSAAPPGPSGPAAAGDIIVFNGASWVNIGHATGPTGPPGPPGPTGPTGGPGPPGTLADGDKGDITVSASGTTWTIDNNTVTLAKLADIVTARIIGRVSPSTGDPEVLNGTQVTALLDLFTTALKGLVPPSPGGIEMFLRADGTWAVPPGGGTAGIIDGGTAGDIGATIDGGLASALHAEILDGDTASAVYTTPPTDGGSA
jgi:hypothetical protein